MTHAQPHAIIVAATVAACTSLTFASIIDLQWVGPNGGLWHDGSHWDPNVIPNNGGGNEYHAIINGARSGALVNLGSSATISELTIGASDHLRINNANSLTLSAANRSGGTINNAGLLEIDSAASTTNLYVIEGEVSLIGGGTVQMNSLTGHIRRNGTIASLLNVDNTIRGTGNLSSTLSTGRLDITNQHLIIADAATPLRIFPTSLHLFTNEGTLRAENGGTLELNAGPYLNVGGLIEALDGSQVSLDGSAIITGGELTSIGSGQLRVTSSTPRLIDLTQSGHLIVNNARSLNIEGAIVNAGDIELASIAGTTSLYIMDSDVTLSGGGTVHMNSSTAHIRRNGGVSSLTNVDNTIRGTGNLSGTGTSSRLDITNHAIITADVDGEVLSIDPTSAHLFTNTGTLRAENGGRLQLNTGPYLNVGGLIEALDNSQVRLSGNAIITGGEITSAGSGQIRVTSSTPRLVNLTHSGHLIVNNAISLDLEGAIVNTGDIELASTTNLTNLYIMDSDVILTGGGMVHMNNSNARIRRNGGVSSLTNIDNTIRGAGDLGSTASAGRLDITNHALITADVDGEVLSIDPTSVQLFTNTGTLRAENGGRLRLGAGPYDNDGGVIEALDNSQVWLSGNAIITGGELTTAGSGQIRVTSSTPRLVDLKSSGNVFVNNAHSLQLEGTIENTGTMSLASTTNNTDLNPMSDPVILTGGGDIVLGGSTSHLRGNGGDRSLINQDNTIRGPGTLSGTGSTTRMDITNNGVILADDDTTPLTIFGNTVGNGFTNASGGLVHVTGLAGLTSSQPGFTNAGGQVTIDEGRTLSRTGHYDQTVAPGSTTTVNGTLAVTGSGNELRLQGGLLNGNGAINGTVRNTGGNIQPGLSTGLLTINGNYIQVASGTLTVEINGDEPIDDYDVLNVTGTASLGGYLAPQIDDNLSPNVGDQWTILLAGTRSGQFAGVVDCTAFRVIYGDDHATIEYTGVVKVGDLNCDGVVNVSDLLLLFDAWGNCPSSGPCPADLNGDDVINVSDLLILFDNWG
jgi:hypothetical protein